MTHFLKIDYKGKYFVIQDEKYDLDYEIGVISKEESLEPSFIKNHKANCEYYGIPAYIGEDKDLLKVYK